VALVDAVPLGVDTPADLEKARTMLEHGPEKWKPVFRKDQAPTKI